MKNYDKKRWIKNKYQIGGRDTDITQIAYSMETEIKKQFGMNDVPEEIVVLYKELTNTLGVGEQMIFELLELVAKHLLIEDDK